LGSSFREHYRWGRTLSYRNIKGDKVYLVDGTWVDEPTLINIMRETWRPSGREDQDWFVVNLGELKDEKRPIGNQGIWGKNPFV
jgi:hypothetical protein